ncbi:ubiquitin carboxyl-terminal hydrolase 40 isoform X1 [Scyliorhinus canicula]|uniref:ubiquitin carboxyl-terminal hydrolase 40 isoform X1 n=1 Tax=Scyliorhinus canicula TaxID=7830 RepID=UPI0018F78F85|nr:ubiquitin carboxyl-terminal hydrolase 40 isoform X1 [Scyliorhinus canicula]
MFGDMFEEEEDTGFVSDNKRVNGRKSRKKDTDPPPHRAASNLSGIKNQGGTCYLNSLLQTLLYTPEFRESLFALGPEELGYLSDKDKPESKVRVIPLELQRLFAQLLLADQLAASTSDLTDSFGWTSNEETSQHDVQELNRILFSALESSLVGTSGHDLINRLYHGIVVNKIVCKECGNISERQEDFLDLTVAVKGVSGLEEALCAFYVEEEHFDNDNLYHCGRCEKLVKATKEAKLRHLPTFLTISLLRFNFDFAKCERYKETGCYSFPVRLDMWPFCEQNDLPDSEYEYELFSVIIHKGGCYGGHYHAYIKDIDQLGTWFSLDEENVVINSTKDPTNVDNLLDLGDPLEILRTILVQVGPDGILVDQLGQKLLEKVGVAWNKRYRKQHGSLRKFLESHPDVFLLKADGTRVAAKQVDHSCPGQQLNKSKGKKAQTGNCKAITAHTYKTEEKQSRTPASDVHWFDFDDSQVRPIQEKEIEKQFQGKECAYMLFYRKSQLQRPAEARGNARYKVPPDLMEEIANLDASLQKQRAEFDSAANLIEVHLHLGPEYKFENGALHPASSQKDSVLTITIDRRKTLGDLRQAIFQLLEFWKGDMVITVAKQLPAGLHLYETFNEDRTSLHSLGITDGAILFVWNSNQVCGMQVQAGEDFEPVLLKVLCPTMNSKLETAMVQFTETQRVFARNTLLASVREALTLSTGISPEELTVYYKKNLGNKASTTWVEYDAEDMHKSLADLRLKDGDSVLATDQKCYRLSVLSSNGMPITIADRSWLQVRNYCGEKLAPTAGATVTIPVTMETLILEIKAHAIEKLKLKDEQEDGTCLRPIDRTGKLLPPVCEDLTVKGIGLKTGSSLALFPGHTPTETQLFLYFSVGDSLHLSPEMEIVVEQFISVRECLKLMLEKAGLTGGYWHLRKTDWCYDAGEVLKDEEATLADMKIVNGETLIIMEGRLPPKGFLILPVWLYQPAPNPENRGCFHEEQENVSDRLCALNIESRDFSLQQYLGTELAYMGNIEISGEASLEDLKTQVLTLPVLQDLSVPSMEFVRVWLVENKCPVKILRNQQQQLSKFKLGPHAEIGIQPLQAEESLAPTELLLRLQMAVPGERSYYPAEEFVWDTSKEYTARALKQKIVQHYSLLPEQIEIAKYFAEQFEWMPMTSWSQQVSKKKKKKKLQSLQGAPYYLKDGDIIGVKNLLIDKNKDFSTMADEIGKEKLRLEDSNKDKRQQATAYQSGDAPENSERKTICVRTRRPEVALSISVADFR